MSLLGTIHRVLLKGHYRVKKKSSDHGLCKIKRVGLLFNCIRAIVLRTFGVQVVFAAERRKTTGMKGSSNRSSCVMRMMYPNNASRGHFYEAYRFRIYVGQYYVSYGHHFW